MTVKALTVYKLLLPFKYNLVFSHRVTINDLDLNVGVYVSTFII